MWPTTQGHGFSDIPSGLHRFGLSRWCWSPGSIHRCPPLLWHLLQSVNSLLVRLGDLCATMRSSTCKKSGYLLIFDSWECFKNKGATSDYLLLTTAFSSSRSSPKDSGWQTDDVRNILYIKCNETFKTPHTALSRKKCKSQMFKKFLCRCYFRIVVFRRENSLQPAPPLFCLEEVMHSGTLVIILGEGGGKSGVEGRQDSWRRWSVKLHLAQYLTVLCSSAAAGQLG